MIGIVDYGVGNLFSLKSSLKYLGLEHIVSADMRELARCDRLILPGVGAFGDARAILAGSGMVWECSCFCRAVRSSARTTGWGL